MQISIGIDAGNDCVNKYPFSLAIYFYR